MRATVLRVRRAEDTRWRAASGEHVEPAGDRLVLEVVDEAQPQRGAGALGSGRRSGLEAVERLRIGRPTPGGGVGVRRPRAAPRGGGPSPRWW